MGISFDIFKGGRESERMAEVTLERIVSEALYTIHGTMNQFGSEVTNQPGLPPMEGTIPDHLVPGMEGITDRPHHEAHEILASGATAVGEAVEASPLIQSELTEQVSEQDKYLNALSFPERGSRLAVNAALNDGALGAQPGLTSQTDFDLAR
jgi:hypothetical protein